MSEEQETQANDQGTETQEAAPPDTGENVDLSDEVEKWKSLARKHETQAKKNAEAAKKLEEIEDSQKSEIEKAADKVAKAEQRAEEAEANLLRHQVAIDKGVPKRLMQFLTATSEKELGEQADTLLAEIGTNETERPPSWRPTDQQLSNGSTSLNGDPLLRDIKNKLGIQ